MSEASRKGGGNITLEIVATFGSGYVKYVSISERCDQVPVPSQLAASHLALLHDVRHVFILEAVLGKIAFCDETVFEEVCDEQRGFFAPEGVGDDPFLVGCDGDGVEYRREAHVGVRMKGFDSLLASVFRLENVAVEGLEHVAVLVQIVDDDVLSIYDV